MTDPDVGETIGVISGVNSSSWFAEDGAGGWRPRFGNLDQLTHDSVLLQYAVIDALGNRRIFHDNDGSLPAGLRGRLKGMEDPSGSHGVVNYNMDLELDSLVWTGVDGQTAAFRYVYNDVVMLLGMLAEVRLEINDKPVRRARYGHAATSSPVATAGDLQLAAFEEWTGAGWQLIREDAYRYYVSGGSGGFVHGLKMQFGPESMRALRAAGLDPLSAAGALVEPYADVWYAYDGDKRVIEERIQGGAEGYTFAWMTADPPSLYSEVNVWNRRCIETLPDGTQTVVYTNRGGAELVRIRKAAGGGDSWVTYHELTEHYLVALRAEPSAVASVSEPATPDGELAVTLHAASGLIHLNDHYSADDFPNGAVKGYLRSRSVQHGTSGSPVLLSEVAYSTQTVDTVSLHDVWKEWRYPVAGAPQHEAALTLYQRQYFEDDFGNPTFQVEQLVTTPPVVESSAHGTGLEESVEEVFDHEGRLKWRRDARGFITFYAYDPATSAETRMIQDADTDLIKGAPTGWLTPSNGGKHLITDYVNDLLGRELKALHPWIEVDPATVGVESEAPLRVRPVDYTHYLDSRYQTWRAKGYMSGEDGEGVSWHILGPVAVSITDHEGHLTDEILAPSGCSCGPLGPDTFGAANPLPDQPTWTRWTHHELDWWSRVVEARVYHTIPDSGPGFEGSNYDATRFGYDHMDRRTRSLSPGGTITREVFDARGFKTATWVGINDNGATDTDPSGGGSPGNNMKPTWLGQYDGGADGGDGNLTQVTLPVSNTSADDRITTFAYDFRNRQIIETQSDGVLDVINLTAYDNLDQPITRSRYHTSVATANRTHESTLSYDLRGRVYAERKFYVNSDGTLGDHLIAGTWYDPNSNVIKQTSQGAKVVTKTVFDSLDRPQTVCQVAEAVSTSGQNTNSVSLDTVIEQTETRYNDAGMVVSVLTRSRFDDATGTGPLQGPNGGQPRSRDGVAALYPDPIGRERFNANFGTAGGVIVVRPALHPSSSDTVLVTEQRYASDGGVAATIDPQGIVNRQFRDAAGRVIRQIENAGVEDSADSRVSEFQYAPDGGLARLILINPTTGNQVTTWTYGSTLAESDIARRDLPVKKTYPTGESETQTYNRQGEITTFTDPNGSVHTYRYDKLGRRTDDSIITLAAGVDGTVRRLSTSYDNRGRVQYLTSGSDPTPAAGTVVNQVKLEYNGIDCLIADIQSHFGAVDGSTLKVQYQCTAAADHILRRTAIIYPNGRTINYEYGAANSIDDVLNRVQSVHDDDLTVLAEYQYVGAAMSSVTTLPEPAVERRWKKLPGQSNGDAGDPYTGYDRFGRVEQMHWIKTGEPSTDLVHVMWGYNRASLKTWRKDFLAPASANQDQHFSYDNLYQVTQRQQGLLNTNTTAVGGIPAQRENFSYDETGNWVQYQRRDDGDLEVDQTRTNQITTIDSNGAGGVCDKNGNMLKVSSGGQALNQPPHNLTWDAWNRLVKVQATGPISELSYYYYDALSRRIQTRVHYGEQDYWFWHDDQWRAIDMRITNYDVLYEQNIWSPANRWELLCRDYYEGIRYMRRYALKDDLDCVAYCTEDGVLRERYVYSAFGDVSYLTPDFEPVSWSSWDFLFHGEFRDGFTGWYNYGYRFYAPELGRWLSRDPIGENGGVNLYSFTINNPINWVDAYGGRSVPYRILEPAHSVGGGGAGGAGGGSALAGAGIGFGLQIAHFIEQLLNSSQPQPQPQPQQRSCTEARRYQLHQAIGRACKGPPFSCKNPPNLCPQELRDWIQERINNGENCLKARENMKNECYPNDNHSDEAMTHKSEIDNTKVAIERCRELLK